MQLTNSDYQEIINKFCDDKNSNKIDINVVRSVLSTNGILIQDINEMLVIVENDKYL
jgi:hypothetical protein